MLVKSLWGNYGDLEPPEEVFGAHHLAMLIGFLSCKLFVKAQNRGLER